MFDHGLNLTMLAIRRQLAAMPHEVFLVRLIHGTTRKAFPGERLWTAAQLASQATVRFLRVRNREGCDVYIHPYAEEHNSGYILVDLDHASPTILDTMRANGHGPCVVLQTSPDNLQAWVQVSATPLEPAVASQIGKQLARLYGGDLASTDLRHLGRLAGFTNQKPQRRNARGYSPWVRVRYARAGLAPQGAVLVQAAECHTGGLENGPSPPTLFVPAWDTAASTGAASKKRGAAGEVHIYRNWLHRLRIPQRYPQPDWSIADKWIAKELLRQGTPAARVATILQCGSPDFPRRHADPQDYLRRTIARAAGELRAAPFSRRDPFSQLGHRTTIPPPGL